MATDKEIQKYLNAIYQNVSVGMQSIHDALPAVHDEKLAKELKREYEAYMEMSKKLQTYANKCSIEPKENSFMEKAKMWMSVKMSTMKDKSVMHLAQIFMLGTVMGLSTCYKDKCDHQDVSKELDGLLDELINIQEENYKNLKVFLKN